MGKCNARRGKLSGDAKRLRAKAGQHHARMGVMTDGSCIYPGCDRPVVGPHPLGGPPSSFCDLEEHNALSAHQERQRLALQSEEHDNEEVRRGE